MPESRSSHSGSSPGGCRRPRTGRSRRSSRTSAPRVRTTALGVARPIRAAPTDGSRPTRHRRDPCDDPLMDYLGQAADEAYAADLDDFVATRSSWAKRARSHGDRDAAKRIGALRKPTVVGWALNRWVRDHADGVTTVRTLGRQLREATRL